MHNSLKLLKFIVLVAVLLNTETTGAANLPQSYQQCIACHGDSGQGNVQLASPAIAGMETWYIKKQLENFKKEKRGQVAGDSYGAQMAAIAKPLSDTDIQELSTALSKLPRISPAKPTKGNAQAGNKYYSSTCSACHSGNARGNPGLKAPALIGLEESYLTRQLINFRKGLRGSHRYDISGQQMAMMAKILPNEQAVDDVVAYIISLNP